MGGGRRSVIHKDNFIYLLILGLFNDAAIILDCIALNCKMISEQWIVKHVGRWDCENLKGRDSLLDLGVDGWMILFIHLWFWVAELLKKNYFSWCYFS